MVAVFEGQQDSVGRMGCNEAADLGNSFKAEMTHGIHNWLVTCLCRITHHSLSLSLSPSLSRLPQTFSSVSLESVRTPSLSILPVVTRPKGSPHEVSLPCSKQAANCEHAHKPGNMWLKIWQA